MQPLEQLVVGVDLSGEPVVGIFVADYYTVVVDVVEGGEEVALVVAAGEGQRVLLRPAGSEHGIEPVVLLTVPYCVEGSLVELSYIGLVVDVLLCIEYFGFLSEHLVGEAEVVGDVRGAALVCTGLCGD